MTSRNGSTRGQGGGAQLDERLGAIKENVKEIIGRGEERVGEIKHRVLEAREQARTRGNQYLDRVTELIRANPLRAVGIAFGLGFIGMRLVRR